MTHGALKKLVAAVGGLVLVSTTLACPVYGVPCTAPNARCVDACDVALDDGGSPRADSTNACFTDGGTP